MLQIILVLVYLALLVWTWLPDWYYNWTDNLFSTMMLTLLLAFLMFFNLGMAIMISRVEVGRSDATCYIYSLRNEAEINGQFFIGSGYINQRQRYFYFWKNDRGGFCLGGIPVNNV